MRVSFPAALRLISLLTAMLFVAACVPDDMNPFKLQEKMEAQQKRAETTMALLNAGEQMSFAFSKEIVALYYSFGQKTPASEIMMDALKTARSTIAEELNTFETNLNSLSGNMNVAIKNRAYFEALNTYKSAQSEIDSGLITEGRKPMRSRSAAKPSIALQEEILSILSKEIYATNGSPAFPQMLARLRLLQIEFSKSQELAYLSEYIAGQNPIHDIAKALGAVRSGESQAYWSDFKSIIKASSSLNVMNGEFKIINGEAVITSVSASNEWLQNLERNYFDDQQDIIFDLYDTSAATYSEAVEANPDKPYWNLEVTVQYRIDDNGLLELLTKSQALLSAARLNLLQQ